MIYEAVVIGVSSGGMGALKSIFSILPSDFNVPIIVVQHINARSDSHWIKLLNASSNMHIKEADEKEKIEKGVVYIAPPNYHLMIEKNKTLSLTIDERVNFARPAIDVLFESAAEAYKTKLIGLILTGSSSDGSLGLKRVKECGGLAVVQDPKTAESSFMPASAIEIADVDYVLPLAGINDLLLKLTSDSTDQLITS